MYARTIEHEASEQIFDFGVSGKLIMNVLVMYDRQTNTFWSQILGEAVDGPLKGTKLEALPVLQTTWSEWKMLYPDTLALVTNGQGSYDSYTGYYNSNRTGVIDESREDSRLPVKELVIGAVINDTPVAYPHSTLATQHVVNDEVGGESVLVVFQPATNAGILFDRVVDDRTLTFEATADSFEIRDVETGSTWYLLTGLAVDGPLKGRQLVRIPSTSSFWFGWKDWHPETLVFGL